MSEIPEFDSLEEGVEFWENADMAQFWDDLEDAGDIKFVRSPEEQKQVLDRLWGDVRGEIANFLADSPINEHLIRKKLGWSEEGWARFWKTDVPPVQQVVELLIVLDLDIEVRLKD